VVEYLRVFCHVGFFLAFGETQLRFERFVISSRRIAKMLVLSRKNGESIVIDGAIKVQVMGVKGTVVRLGIDAPKEIPVHRSEIYGRIRANERARAAPEKLDQGGRSQLHDAVIDHRRGRIVELLAAGADVNRKDNGGWTPLHFAAQEQVVAIARTLVEAGAEVDSKDHFGNTPLWRAVSDYRGDGRLIVFLRHKEADAFAENEKGVSPVGLARRITNYDVAKFFCDLAN
jgi:carbon storage regulator CsrA